MTVFATQTDIANDLSELLKQVQSIRKNAERKGIDPDISDVTIALSIVGGLLSQMVFVNLGTDAKVEELTTRMDNFNIRLGAQEQSRSLPN